MPCMLKDSRQDMMAHICNPSTGETKVGGSLKPRRVGDQPGQYSETSFLQKIKKISWVWWCMPVVPATPEAEVGGLLEPRRLRLQ